MEQTRQQEINTLIKNAGVTDLKSSENRTTNLEKNKEELLAYIRNNAIGTCHDTVIQTVYGEKPMVYADYTASGKSLRFIENYV